MTNDEAVRAEKIRWLGEEIQSFLSAMFYLRRQGFDKTHVAIQALRDRVDELRIELKKLDRDQ